MGGTDRLFPGGGSIFGWRRLVTIRQGGEAWPFRCCLGGSDGAHVLLFARCNFSKSAGVYGGGMGGGTTWSPAEDPSEVAVERIDPDGFDGQQGLVVEIEFAATRGLSEQLQLAAW